MLNNEGLIKNSSETKRRSILIIICLIFLAFLFRFAFGVTSEFWFVDEQQIYLLGLKFFTTGQWPFFGPDVVYTQSQIPGALQALLVGLPFFVLPIPEAPFIFINLLNLGALIILGLYCKKLFPEIPNWFLWGWLFVAPWALQYTTHVLNPMYAFPGAVLFLISSLELIPTFNVHFMNKKLAAFLAGASILWIFQLHMSWVITIPLIFFAFLLQWVENKKPPLALGLFFLLGCLSIGSLVIPTFIKYGIHQGLGGTDANVVFKWSNLLNIFYIIPRFLSFGTYELSYFLGPNTQPRIDMLKRFIWAAPFIITAGILGIGQAIIMIIAFFRRDSEKRWKTLKLFILMMFLVVYALFFFSIKSPSSHTFFILMPLAMIFFFYSIKPYLNKKIWRTLAIILLFSSFIANSVMGIRNFQDKSLYKNRKLIVQAIQEKNYQIMGQRRATFNGIGY